MTDQQIPTDITGLIHLLRATPIGDHPDISEVLATQLGDRGKAYDLIDAAQTAIRHDNEIGALRGVLGVALKDASARLQEAIHAVETLASSRLYDIEYAESTTADDLRHQLAEAARAVRIARALQAQIER